MIFMLLVGSSTDYNASKFTIWVFSCKVRSVSECAISSSLFS